MSQNESGAGNGNQGKKKAKDPFLDVIRALPRLRSIERDAGAPAYSPPPPSVVRLGAVLQGCGGCVLVLLSLLTLGVAFTFGYYLWGPILMLTGGAALIVGMVGIWRGKQSALVFSLILLAIELFMMYTWQSFITVAGRAASGTIMSVMYIGALTVGSSGLVVAAVLLGISLFYWRRLAPLSMRSILIWGSALVLILIVPFSVSSREQKARRTWLIDHRDDWLSQKTADRLTMGASINVIMGFSFVNFRDTDSVVAFDVRQAELRAALETGVSMIRIGASGDTLYRQQELDASAAENATSTALGTLVEDATQVPVTPQATAELLTPEEADEQNKVYQELDYEQQYIAQIKQAGAELLLVDSYYSPYLIDKTQDLNLSWDEFKQLHEERVRYYVSRYQPDVYTIVYNPELYTSYIDGQSGSDQKGDDTVDAWVEHTKQLIADVHEFDSNIRVAVEVSVYSDFDLRYYEKVLGLEGLDLIGVEINQQESFNRVETMLADRGDPRDHGQELWITNTWYGVCAASQRSMELDSLWLEAVVAFAAQQNITAVFSNDFGCFVQAGGTLLSQPKNLDQRTQVWETWQRLVQTWQPSSS